MRVNDRVIYKNRLAIVIQIKWGLYCIRFEDTGKQIWVSCDAVVREDHKWN